jgi:hypothetical protein
VKPGAKREFFAGLYCRELIDESFKMPYISLAMSEEEIESLENRFPAASGSAFAAARKEALAAGESVLESENGTIYEVFPDGTRKRVKDIQPPVPVAPGSKINLE